MWQRRLVGRQRRLVEELMWVGQRGGLVEELVVGQWGLLRKMLRREWGLL
jgi:hypothetical protein